MDKETKKAVIWWVNKNNPVTSLDLRQNNVLDYVLDNYGKIDIDGAAKEYQQFVVDKASVDLIQAQAKVVELQSIINSK